jgi:hypothetical protein
MAGGGHTGGSMGKNSEENKRLSSGLNKWRQTKEKPNRDLAKKCKMLVEAQGEENVFALAKVSLIQGGT